MNILIKVLLILIFNLLFIIPKTAYSECAKPKMPSNDEWEIWLKEITKEAINYGINRKIAEKEFSNLKPLEKIILRDRCQPESTISFKEYLYYRLDKTRIYTGKLRKKESIEILKKIGNEYNIQPKYILSIWGMESYYGKNQGKSQVIPVLTTLTFDRRRSDFYKKQLFAALKMLNDGLINSENLKGSWAGAMGQAQFLPTTYLESAVDYDKDGKRDIWNSKQDVFASIANYLTSLDKAPWNVKVDWGIEVSKPNNIESFFDSLKQINPKGCYAVKTMSVEKTITEWKKIGFKNIDGSSIENSENLKARLVSPDGINGKMFLVFPNYKAILYYNCSHYYALTIGLLSDKLED